ncbi:MAG: SCO family protein [Hyphomicrobiaceae bacterium]|nr:SCO family protein [Hyphomicrobiaceae bacterium]
MKLAFIALALAAALLPRPAAAGNAEDAIALSQEAVGQYLPDLAFTDTDGSTVRLMDYRGKPLLVSMIYTSCADVCPTLLESLYPAVKVARKALGDDSFAVITVGFDTRNDTPSRLRAFARTRGIDIPNWTFLAADEESLDALARTVGFGIYSRAGGFDHLAQVSLIDARGRLSQQVYGSVFEPPVIVDPLKALVFGRFEPLRSVDGLIDRIRYFCTVYDPSSGRYRFNYSLFVSVGIGIACFILIVVVLAREWRRSSASGARPS